MSISRRNCSEIFLEGTSLPNAAYNGRLNQFGNVLMKQLITSFVLVLLAGSVLDAQAEQLVRELMILLLQVDSQAHQQQ